MAHASFFFASYRSIKKIEFEAAIQIDRFHSAEGNIVSRVSAMERSF